MQSLFLFLFVILKYNLSPELSFIISHIHLCQHHSFYKILVKQELKSKKVFFKFYNYVRQFLSSNILKTKDVVILKKIQKNALLSSTLFLEGVLFIFGNYVIKSIHVLLSYTCFVINLEMTGY